MSHHPNIIESLHNVAKENASAIEKLFAVAQPSAVYSEPVTFDKHAHSIITASEVLVGMGLGYGMGGGEPVQGNLGTETSTIPVPEPALHRACRDVEGELVEGGSGTVEGEPIEGDVGSGGGGGGGYSHARPVAIISIGPNGVRVEPVVDVTKIAIALFTAIASMSMIWAKIYKASHR